MVNFKLQGPSRSTMGPVAVKYWDPQVGPSEEASTSR